MAYKTSAQVMICEHDYYNKNIPGHQLTKNSCSVELIFPFIHMIALIMQYLIVCKVRQLFSLVFIFGSKTQPFSSFSA